MTGISFGLPNVAAASSTPQNASATESEPKKGAKKEASLLMHKNAA